MDLKHRKKLLLCQKKRVFNAEKNDDEEAELACGVTGRCAPLDNYEFIDSFL
jgi:hypothetical protein